MKLSGDTLANAFMTPAGMEARSGMPVARQSPPQNGTSLAGRSLDGADALEGKGRELTYIR